MNRAFVIALKEVRSYVQDRADLAFSLLLPIAIFALMYGAFGGDLSFNGTAYVVNEDVGGQYSTRLLEELKATDSLEIELLSAGEADTRLDNSDLGMVLFIPTDFSENLEARQPAELVFKQRGNGGTEGQIVASMVRGAVSQMNQQFQVFSQVRGALAGTGISQESIRLTTTRFLDRETEHPLVGVTEETIGASVDPVNQFLPGVITMFVLFAVTLSARAIVEERKIGTLERLLTSRLSVGELFIGKFLASVSRGFVQTTILLVLAYIVFQIFTPLSFIQSLVIALVFAAAASALGLVIASVARTEDGATWFAIFFTMAMVMVGGTFFTIPEDSVLYPLSRVSLNSYANEAFNTVIAQGGSLFDLGKELGILAAIVVIGLLVSRLLFRAMPGGR